MSNYLDISEYSFNTDKIKQLILENPELPLIIIAGENACEYGYSEDFCSKAQAYLGEFLNCEQDFDEGRIFTDREDFQDIVYDYYYHYCDIHLEGSEREQEEYIEKKISEYDPYWEKCIILYVDN